IESAALEDTMLAPPAPAREVTIPEGLAEPSREPSQTTAPMLATQDNEPRQMSSESIVPAANMVASEPPSPPQAATPPDPTPPQHGASAPGRVSGAPPARGAPPPAPAVIPIVRAPDDPGVDEEAPADEFAEQIGTPKQQAGGWRGFLSRWAGS